MMVVKLWLIFQVDLMLALIVPAFFVSKKKVGGVIQFTVGIILLAIQVLFMALMLIR